MKRIVVVLLAVLCLAGCGTHESDAVQDYFTFRHNGIEIAPHAEAEPVIAALGAPQSYTEEPSCGFEGMDKTYCYGSFYLSTYPMDGKEYVNSIWFADHTVVTEEGIRIGSSQSQVEEAYGKDSFNGINSYVLTRGQSRLMILVADGFVSSIRYEGILD